ncbi:unnamed protein product [Miscanthus lutarioriparius]|uniref:Uncharacterized protein n=1 Tax=Miscanthus lutarioriparius TaxID=422564 RepID=A0A811RD88_9POAL|nr:unnamed protein product [Miscanthus lutarioriparius]
MDEHPSLLLLIPAHGLELELVEGEEADDDHTADDDTSNSGQELQAAAMNEDNTHPGTITTLTNMNRRTGDRPLPPAKTPETKGEGAGDWQYSQRSLLAARKTLLWLETVAGDDGCTAGDGRCAANDGVRGIHDAGATGGERGGGGSPLPLTTGESPEEQREGASGMLARTYPSGSVCGGSGLELREGKEREGDDASVDQTSIYQSQMWRCGVDLEIIWIQGEWGSDWRGRRGKEGERERRVGAAAVRP